MIRIIKHHHVTEKNYFFDENYQTPVIAACKQKENRLKLTSHQQNRGCRCKGGCSLTCHSPQARASTLLNRMEILDDIGWCDGALHGQKLLHQRNDSGSYICFRVPEEQNRMILAHFFTNHDIALQRKTGCV